jgi:hypothetical protein
MSNFRSMSPRIEPANLVQPPDEEMDFDDPPYWVRNNALTRTFWYISKEVRDIVLDQGQGSQVFFCFNGGYCRYETCPDPSVAKARIENHFKKKPHHRVHLNQWKFLAEERRRRRDQLRMMSREGHPRREERRHDSPPRRPHFDRSISCQLPSTSSKATGQPRSRTPPDRRDRYPGGRSRSPGDNWSPSYNISRSPRDYRRDDRTEFHRAPLSRSPPPDRPNRSPPSPFWSPHSREMQWSSPSRSPPPPGRQRSSSPHISKSGTPFAQTKLPVNSSKRSYSGRPGAAMGRYNSRLDRSKEPRQEDRVKEWVCKPQGRLPGCGRIFHSQKEYSDHINQRELKQGCPDEKLVCLPSSEKGASIEGCRRSFKTRDEYKVHIQDRNANRRCPPLGESGNKMKKDHRNQNDLNKRSTPEIIIDDSPPSSPRRPSSIKSVSPKSSEINVRVSSAVSSDKAVSPPRSSISSSNINSDTPLLNLEASPLRLSDVAVSPPRASDDFVSATNIVEEQVVSNKLTEADNTLTPLPAQPRLKVKSDIFRKYPTVQRSPSGSPNRETSIPIQPRVLRSPDLGDGAPHDNVYVQSPETEDNIPSATAGPVPFHTEVDRLMETPLVEALPVNRYPQVMREPDTELPPLLQINTEQDRVQKNTKTDKATLPNIPSKPVSVIPSMFNIVDSCDIIHPHKSKVLPAKVKDNNQTVNKKKISTTEDQIEMFLDKKKRGVMMKAKSSKPAVKPDHITVKSSSSSKGTLGNDEKKKVNKEISKPTKVNKTRTDFLTALSKGDKIPQDKGKKRKLEIPDKASERRVYVEKKKSKAQPTTDDDASVESDVLESQQTVVGSKTRDGTNVKITETGTEKDNEKNKPVNVAPPLLEKCQQESAVSPVEDSSKTSNTSEINSETVVGNVSSQVVLSSENLYNDGNINIRPNEESTDNCDAHSAMEVTEESTSVERKTDEENLLESFDFACSSCERTFPTPDLLNDHNITCTDTRHDLEIFKGGTLDSYETDMDTHEELDNFDEDGSLKLPSISSKPIRSLNQKIISSDEEPVDEYSGLDSQSSGPVTSLFKALGGGSDSETEEEDDNMFIVRNGVDNCDECPRCHVPLDSSNPIFNLIDYSIILVCSNTACRAEVKMMNVMGEEQKMLISCAL